MSCRYTHLALAAFVALTATPGASAQYALDLRHHFPTDSISCSDVLVVTVHPNIPNYQVNWEFLNWEFDKALLNLTQIEEEDGIIWEFRPLAADTGAAIVISDERFPDAVNGVLHINIRPAALNRISLTDDKDAHAASISVASLPITLTAHPITECANVQLLGNFFIDSWIIEPKDWNRPPCVTFADNNLHASQRTLRATPSGHNSDSSRVIVVYQQPPSSIHPTPSFFRDTFFLSVLPNYVEDLDLTDLNNNHNASIYHTASIYLKADAYPNDASDKSVQWVFDRSRLNATFLPNNQAIFTPIHPHRDFTSTIRAFANLPTPNTSASDSFNLTVLPILLSSLNLTNDFNKHDTTIPPNATFTLHATFGPDSADFPHLLQWTIPPGLEVVTPTSDPFSRTLRVSTSNTSLTVSVHAADGSGLSAAFNLTIPPIFPSHLTLNDPNGLTSSIAPINQPLTLTAAVLPLDNAFPALSWALSVSPDIATLSSIPDTDPNLSQSLTIFREDTAFTVSVTSVVNPDLKAHYFVSVPPVPISAISISDWTGTSIQPFTQQILHAVIEPLSKTESALVEWDCEPADAVCFVDVDPAKPLQRTILALKPNSTIFVSASTNAGLLVAKRSIYVDRIHLQSVDISLIQADLTPPPTILLPLAHPLSLTSILSPANASNISLAWSTQGDIHIDVSPSDPASCSVYPTRSNSQGTLTLTASNDAGESKQAVHTFLIPPDAIALTDLNGVTDSIIDLDSNPVSIPFTIELAPQILKADIQPLPFNLDFSRLRWTVRNTSHAYLTDAPTTPNKLLHVLDNTSGAKIIVLLTSFEGLKEAAYTLTFTSKPPSTRDDPDTPQTPPSDTPSDTPTKGASADPPTAIAAPNHTPSPLLSYAHGSLHLRDACDYTCHISTLSGRPLYSFLIPSTNFSQTLPLSPGLYLVSLTNASRHLTLKLIAH
jgi:hypothetical protein